MGIKGFNTWNKNTNIYEDCGDYTVIITIKGHRILIDKDVIDIAKRYGWTVCEQGIVRSESRVGDADGGGRLVLLSRLVMGAKPNQQVDHINQDRLDNRRINLRLCTNQQNCCNRGLRSDNRTGYKCVRIAKRNGKFVARIAIHGIRKELIYTRDIIEAAQAYNIAAQIIHGEFARVNENLPPPNKELKLKIIERVNRLFGTGGFSITGMEVAKC